MRFSIIALGAFVCAVAAKDYKPCEGLYGNAKCCATDVLGIADLDCKDVDKTPTDATDFKDICAEGGQQAYCCAIPAVSDLDLSGLKSGCWLTKIVAGWTRCSVQAAYRRLNRSRFPSGWSGDLETQPTLHLSWRTMEAMVVMIGICRIIIIFTSPSQWTWYL